MKDVPSYRKFIYWLEPDGQEESLSKLRKDVKRIHAAKRHPCEALYPRRELVLVEPRIWDLQCKRQGSWYRASPRNGQTLLVSNKPLDALPLWGTLTLEAFSPPRTAGDEDVLEMMSDPRAADHVPPGWGSFSPWEPQAIQQLLTQDGIDRSLQEIFSYYTANHLNFVYPRFFVSSDEHPVIPYSIQKTNLICSACVEMFGILGDAFPVQYLVPCPGLKYLKPPPGHYIRVDQAPP